LGYLLNNNNIQISVI